MFHEKLPVVQIQKLDSVLRHLKLDQLVVKLYLLISLYIRGSKQQEKETRYFQSPNI